MDAGRFLKAKFDGNADIRGSIRPDLLRAIVNCFSKTDDCSEHHLALLK